MNMVRSPDYRTAVWSTYEEMGSWQKIDEQTCDLIGVPKGWVMNELEELIRKDLSEDPNISLPDSITDSIITWEEILGDYYGSELIERVFARLPGVFAVYGREFDDSDYVVVCMVKAELPCNRTHLDAVINRGAPP